ncbi:sensory rhodopsin transducer [Nonomuraea fuscirosea]|uniref:sensory rhodopsin transducer n=1 Tax=Nonomuraea fuscirosea TaxID=1291556 RepID=UPI00343F05E2
MSTMAGDRKMTIVDGCMPGDQFSLLNVSAGNARVELTLCAEGGQPLGPIRLVIPPQRTRSSVLADLVGAGLAVRELPYSVVVVSDAPVLVQPHPADRDAPQTARRPADRDAPETARQPAA